MLLPIGIVCCEKQNYQNTLCQCHKTHTISDTFRIKQHWIGFCKIFHLYKVSVDFEINLWISVRCTCDLPCELHSIWCDILDTCPIQSLTCLFGIVSVYITAKPFEATNKLDFSLKMCILVWEERVASDRIYNANEKVQRQPLSMLQ